MRSEVKKIEPPERKAWRKAYMIDLNTLDTKEKWVKKLERLSPEARTAMRQAMWELKISPDWFG